MSSLLSCFKDTINCVKFDIKKCYCCSNVTIYENCQNLSFREAVKKSLFNKNIDFGDKHQFIIFCCFLVKKLVKTSENQVAEEFKEQAIDTILTNLEQAAIIAGIDLENYYIENKDLREDEEKLITEKFKLLTKYASLANKLLSQANNFKQKIEDLLANKKAYKELNRFKEIDLNQQNFSTLKPSEQDTFLKIANIAFHKPWLERKYSPFKCCIATPEIVKALGGESIIKSLKNFCFWDISFSVDNKSLERKVQELPAKSVISAPLDSQEEHKNPEVEPKQAAVIPPSNPQTTQEAVFRWLGLRNFLK